MWAAGVKRSRTHRLGRWLGATLGAAAAGVVWGGIAAVAARFALDVTEEQAILYVGVPAALLVCGLTWKPFARNFDDDPIDFSEMQTLTGPYRSSRLQDLGMKIEGWMLALLVPVLVLMALVQGAAWLAAGETMRFALVFGIAGLSLLLRLWKRGFLIGVAGALLVAALWP